MNNGILVGDLIRSDLGNSPVIVIINGVETAKGGVPYIYTFE